MVGGGSRLSSFTALGKIPEAGYDVSSRLSWQTTKVMELEARITALEATAINGNERSNDCRREVLAIDPMISPDPSIVADARLAQHRSGSTETMLFRGKGFKGQFYGASNPASSISHVRIPPHAVRHRD